MSSPFPGMDPYLEDSEHWRSFHHSLPDEIMAQLNRILSEKYYADVEVRTTLEEVGIAAQYPIYPAQVYPDTAVLQVESWGSAQAVLAVAPAAPIQRLAMSAEETKQRTVHVYVTETKQLVTAIEILSPANKRGAGLEEYRQKRARLLRSAVHLIEIDLLRAGQRPGWKVNNPAIDTDYVLLVNRKNVDGDRMSEIWPVGIDETLPMLPVPLLFPDPDVPLNLKEAIDTVYQRGVYQRRIDYSKPLPPPSPRTAVAAWLAEL